MTFNLSKYRSKIMGIATIFIVLCHSTFFFDNALLDDLFNIYVVQLLQFGVDIFLLVSGFGCYYSMKRDPSVWKFYKKRAVRILIPYILAAALMIAYRYFVSGDELKWLLYGYSLVSFFISGDLTAWFVPAIIVLYILFPLLYKLVNKSEVLFLIIAFSIAIFTALPLFQGIEHPMIVVNEIFFTRIPVFLIGILLGKFSINNDSKIKCNYYLMALLFIISLVVFTFNAKYNDVNKWAVTRVIFLPISLSFVVLMSGLFDKLNRKDKINPKNVLVFLGSISFEVYLTHEIILVHMPEQVWNLFDGMTDPAKIAIINVIAIIASIIVSFIISKLSGLIKKIIP